MHAGYHRLAKTPMRENTDTELLAAARDGNKDAFGSLIERYQPMTERIAQRMVGNGFIAQELAQEAVLQAYLSLDRLRNDAQFASWLYGITLNVCRTYLRSQKREVSSLEALMGGMFVDPSLFSEGVIDPLALAEEHEVAQVIWHAVYALSPAEREATLLFYYAQFHLSEIAGILGISVGAVKGRLHKARKQLKEELSPWFAETSVSQVWPPRRKIMIQVAVVDSVTVTNKEVSRPAYSVVVLHDEAHHRALGIWVGQAEAFAIDRGLRQSPLPRPMTMNFIASILHSLGAVLEEVRIESLKEQIFYATTRIRSVNMLHEINARPSDAIALAVVTGTPIFVSEEVLGKAGVALPEGKTLHRIDAPTTEEQREQQTAGEALVLEEECEECTEAEYERIFQRVLQILMR
jgi:RNA polymerase sigma factor (sigma-70 family)